MSGRANALLPPLFFAPAALWFLAALGAAPLLVSGLLVHFYRARILALTHMITLGWLSMAMMGVLYRYLPALVKRPLPFPRLALLQWATFVVGVLAFVVHLWLGRWSGAAWAGGLLVGSAVLLCANIWPLLRTAPRHGVAEVGVFAASAFLVVAATIGTLLAIGKSPPILPGGTLDNLAGHAHLAGAGWVGITVCALSYRFLPAFLLPEFDPVVVARRLVVLLVAAVAALAWTLFTRSGAATALAIGLAAGVLGHAALVTRVVVSHRLPLDWTTWQAVASTAWCAFAAAGGAATAVVGVDDALGARLAAANAIAGLLGWFSNLLIGVSYKLFPAFVMAARTELGRAQVPLASLSVPEAVRPVVLALFNAGLVTLVGGLLADLPAALVTGAVLLALGGALYGVCTLRTLAYVVLEPPDARSAGGPAVTSRTAARGPPRPSRAWRPAESIFCVTFALSRAAA